MKYISTNLIEMYIDFFLTFKHINKVLQIRITISTVMITKSTQKPYTL